MNDFLEILIMSQEELYEHVLRKLEETKLSFYEDRDAIFVKGEIPITIVAHMDVARMHPYKVHSYHGVVFQRCGDGYCLGGDDRTGVYAMLYHLMSFYPRPNLLFTTDEESGCIGATNFIKALKDKAPDVHQALEETRFFIQLDRRGERDCVFYSDEPKDFREYIESFGFTEEYGSFSDISVICDDYRVCGTNLSTGYYSEHSGSEIVVFPYLMETIEKVQNLLLANIDETKMWVLPESKYKYQKFGRPRGAWSTYASDYIADYNCAICGSGLWSATEEHYGVCHDCIRQYEIRTVTREEEEDDDDSSDVPHTYAQWSWWCDDCGREVFDKDEEGLNVCADCLSHHTQRGSSKYLN